MSLFSKTKINPDMEPFIKSGSGVGIVKVDGYGKASARVESHKLILESYKDDYPIIESVSSITFLSFDPGNFFQEPKLVVGVGNKEYTLAGVDNNDEELEAFYDTILDLKNKEKKQNPKSIDKSTSKPLLNTNDEIDELKEVEGDLENKSNKKPKQGRIRNFLRKHDKEPDDLETVLEDNEDGSGSEVKTREIESENSEKIGTSEKSEIEKIEEMEDADEFDEIEDFEVFDDFEVDQEIVIEDDDDFEEFVVEESGDKKIAENKKQETVKEVKPPIKDKKVESKHVSDSKINKQQQQVKKPEIKKQEVKKPEAKKSVDKKVTENKPQKQDKVIPKVKDTQKQDKVVKPAKDTQKQIDKKENQLTNEKDQVKDQENEVIDNSNQEISAEDASQVNVRKDPIDQIRGYYELKEEGIITEEEFELKKKQLLDL